MNTQIHRLYELGREDNRLIIGLMSGTSLDGLDIALCRIHGSGRSTKLNLLHFVTKPYDDMFRTRVREVFAKRHIDQQVLCGLHAYIGKVHAELINATLTEWAIRSQDIDLIASHGQTVYHAPQSLTQDRSMPNSTLQIGDADHIAVGTGIITVSDFRQKQIAAGGEGAPLAAYGDHLLYTDSLETRILLNIGGISNFTFLPKQGSGGQAFATDLGPGNTLMNQYMFKYLGKEMDEDGKIAASGSIQQDLLDLLLEEEFLKLAFPKTTGPELFNLSYLSRKAGDTYQKWAHEDIMATLNAFSARTIVDGIKQVAEGTDNTTVYISGGGLHNRTLLHNIKKELPPHVRMDSMASLGMDPDAKEACLFALLANETVAGEVSHVSNIKDSPAVCMGKISFPF